MFYVVGKHRILVESEVPVQMGDYPDCELIEGPKGVNLISFEAYTEGGIRRVRTKLQKEPLRMIVESDVTVRNGCYEIKAGGESVKFKVRLEGNAHLPPLFTMPEGYVTDSIKIECSRGKLSTPLIIKEGEFSWKPIDETIECSLILTALNFPPIQKFVRIKLI
jgi:hypothetical protein